MLILALDIGKFNTMCCTYDSESRKHEFLNATTDRVYLETVFKKCKADLVVMEACGPSGWINDLAVACGHKTLVCSTNEDAWKWMNVKRKTDRDDALKIARMAAMGELKPVFMPSEQHREFRSLIKYRKTLDGRITKIKCTIRAWFVNHGISIDAGEKAWTTGRERINSFRKSFEQCSPAEHWKAELDIELTQLDALSGHLEVVTKKLDAIGKNDPRVIRVQTIPGVGPRTAEIIVACIDDPHRFKNGRQVSAYFGLVPRKFQSGEMDRNGRITKRGNPLARAILTQCAWISLRYNSWAKAIFDRIAGKQKTRRKKAVIALARKIAVIAWAMLRDGKDWDPKTMIATTEKFGKIPLEVKKIILEMKPKKCRQTRMNGLESRAHNSTKAASAKAAVKAQATQAAEEKNLSYTETLGTKTKPTSRKSALGKKTSIKREGTNQRRARKRAVTTDAVTTYNMTSTE